MPDIERGWKWFGRAESSASALQIAGGAVVVIGTSIWSLIKDWGPLCVPISLFSLGCFLWVWRQASNKGLLPLWGEKKESKQKIVFDFPLIPPGWTLKMNDQSNPPSFDLTSVGGVQCLKISNAPTVGSYWLDYYFTGSRRMSHVSFKLTDWNSVGVVYVILQLSVGNRMFRFPRYFTVDLTNPQSDTDGRERWLPISPSPDGQWHRVEFDLQHWMNQVYPGESLLGVRGFRIRGEMKIASIEWS